MIRMRIFLSVFFWLALIAGAWAQTNQAGEPVLIQKDSPYTVYESFIGATEKLENSYTLYVNNKSASMLKSLLSDVARIRQLFDLSEIPPANRIRIGDNVITYLYDILARIPKVDPETIPGYPIANDSNINKDLPLRWTIPNTDIQIVRIEDGPYSGEYQFSAASVDKMAQYYDRFINLPVINKRIYPFFYIERSNTTGHLIPNSFSKIFPSWLQTHYFDTPAWKILVISLYTIFILVISLLWLRLGLKRANKKIGLNRSVRLLIIPVGLLVLLYFSDRFIVQLNPSGSLASGESVITTILYYSFFAWTAWVFIYFLADVLVRILHFLAKDYDEALLRLSTKLLSAIAIITILINGADQIGIPALGIIAGFGVGGIAVALASQPTLENIFGGLSLFADRPFRVGDKIYFNHQSAQVLRIGPRSTRLRTRDGSLCTVPNSDLAKMHIINLTLRNSFYLDQTIALQNDSTADDISKLTVLVRERLLAEELVEKKEGWPRVQLVDTDLGRINIRIRASLLTDDYSEFLSSQELIMLDVLRYMEQLDLKLAQAYYRQA